jgi:hypothetical protein
MENTERSLNRNRAKTFGNGFKRNLDLLLLLLGSSYEGLLFHVANLFRADLLPVGIVDKRRCVRH